MYNQHSNAKKICVQNNISKIIKKSNCKAFTNVSNQPQALNFAVFTHSL